MQVKKTLKRPVPEFIDPRFRENKPKTLVFSHRKRAYWACFHENWVYIGHSTLKDAQNKANSLQITYILIRLHLRSSRKNWAVLVESSNSERFKTGSAFRNFGTGS